MTWNFFSPAFNEHTAPLGCRSVFSEMNLSSLWELVLDREVWRAVVHGVIKSQTWLSELNWNVCMKILTWLDQLFLLLLVVSFFCRTSVDGNDYPLQHSCLGISLTEEPGKLRVHGGHKKLVMPEWLNLFLALVFFAVTDFYHLSIVSVNRLCFIS